MIEALSYEQLKQQLEAREREVMALTNECVLLKSNLIFWDADNPEMPYDSPKEIADDCAMDFNQEFEVQVAARMPNRIYRVCHVSEYDCELELVETKPLLTPAVTAALAEVEAKAIEKFAAQQEEKLKAAALIGATHLEACHEFAALQARAFAVELREGRA